MEDPVRPTDIWPEWRRKRFTPEELETFSRAQAEMALFYPDWEIIRPPTLKNSLNWSPKFLSASHVETLDILLRHSSDVAPFALWVTDSSACDETYRWLEEDHRMLAVYEVPDTEWRPELADELWGLMELDDERRRELREGGPLNQEELARWDDLATSRHDASGIIDIYRIIHPDDSSQQAFILCLSTSDGQNYDGLLHAGPLRTTAGVGQLASLIASAWSGWDYYIYAENDAEADLARQIVPYFPHERERFHIFGTDHGPKLKS